MSDVARILEREEGRVLHAYQDHLGFWTIGVGRLIDKRRGGGISDAECDLLLGNDLDRIENALSARWPWTDALDPVRRGCLVLMAFQMGVDGLAEFTVTLSHVREGRFILAANAMLQSKWAKVDTPARAARVADAMQTGRWP